jgi:four helix bundle protein
MSKQLQDRTRAFSVSIIDLAERLDYSISKKVVITQLVRSATSVAANYRATCRARSDRDFFSKLNIVLEEADESCLWLEIISDKRWMDVSKELNEARELTAIVTAALKTMQNRKFRN